MVPPETSSDFITTPAPVPTDNHAEGENPSNSNVENSPSVERNPHIDGSSTVNGNQSIEGNMHSSVKDNGHTGGKKVPTGTSGSPPPPQINQAACIRRKSDIFNAWWIFSSAISALASGTAFWLSRTRTFT